MDNKLKDILISGEQHGFGFFYSLFKEKNMDLGSEEKKQFDSYKRKVLGGLFVSLILLLLIIIFIFVN